MRAEIVVTATETSAHIYSFPDRKTSDHRQEYLRDGGSVRDDEGARPPMSQPAPMILAVPDLIAEPAPAESADAAGTPGGVDIAGIVADLQDDNVSAPDEHGPALLDVVAHARDQGYDINLVVLTEPQPTFTIFRDIATAVQKEMNESGGTVVVLGPNASGTSSVDFSRDTLEKATERVPLQDPPQAAREVVNEILAPGPDWTLITMALIVGVVIAAVATRITSVRLRARRGDAADLDGSAGVPEAGVGTSLQDR